MSSSNRGGPGWRTPATRSPTIRSSLRSSPAASTPPEPIGVDKTQLRELVRRKLVVERDGIYFHPTTIDNVAIAAARLLQVHPDGFTVAQLRDDLGISRKYALPLVGELDARGITRRRGDLRVAGPRLPGVGAASAPA